MAWVIVAAGVGGACRFDLSEAPRPDGGGDGASGDGARDAVMCPDAAPTTKVATGGPCVCDIECQSGICADGTCCRTACKDRCFSCGVPGLRGTCTLVPAGLPPARAADCADDGPTSCGQDGTCDGRGGCGKYPRGAPCAAGRCDGAAVVAARACDGRGTCQDAPVVTCAPFGCDASATPPRCHAGCSDASQCVTGRDCTGGSCGKKFDGAACTVDAECASAACADGVCCNVPCKGECVSCNRIGAVGVCTPTPNGHPDPRKLCVEEKPASCGQTGVCDGTGRCARYPSGTVCAPAVCSATRLAVAGTCDGGGNCRAGGSIDCAPYACKDGACRDLCVIPDDCSAGHTCMGGSCGKKGNGQTCAMAADCGSGFCVDGVCCVSACAGPCRTCAGATPGACEIAGAGMPDPRGTCTDKGKAACAEDGRCDGTGACRKYPTGTVCAEPTCTGSVATGVSTCDASGRCAAGPMMGCAPYVCNGPACFAACSKDADCVAPNKCVAGSCGKKGNGQPCTDAVDCLSGFCAQGVCCNSACGASCQACNLAGSAGTCSNVGAGVADPKGVCRDGGVAGCGQDGTCNGAGACRKYPLGAVCKAGTCPPGTATRTQDSTCDGNGTCRAGGTQTCAPFLCDPATAACRSTCTLDADCVPGNACVMGSCGKKPNGSGCSTATECQSGQCAQGVCCNSPCSGGCRSCALAGSAGTCSNLGSGAAAIEGGCPDVGAASCGTDGHCDGAGACRKYPNGTLCAGATCPAGDHVLTLARTCDGAGTCRPPSTQDCSPYRCDGSAACRATCGGDADCVAPNTCAMGSCGKKPNGGPCSAGSECVSGWCSDGVCCDGVCSGLCQACNLAGSVGTCKNIPAGSPSSGDCMDAGQATCGNNGLCDGAGGCMKYPSGAVCAPQTCPAGTSVLTYASVCNGSGSCAGGTTMSCGAYRCDGAQSCLSGCGGDGDCTPPLACIMGLCGATKSNGSSCMSGSECTSGNCVDGVCCASSSCGTCQTCAPSGFCSAVPDGDMCSGGLCHGGSCCAGCWDGATCRAGNTLANCGSGGGSCSPCGLCEACSSGACSPTSGTSCRQCGVCSSGACIGSGGGCPACQSCSGSGTCVALTDGTACGTCHLCAGGTCGAAADGTDCGGACTDAYSGTARICGGGACSSMPLSCTGGTSCCPLKKICEDQCIGGGGTPISCGPVVIETCTGTNTCCDGGGAPYCDKPINCL